MRLYVPRRLEAEEIEPGDYGLLRYPGTVEETWRIMLGWNYDHAVLVGNDGYLIEAWYEGVRKVVINDYPTSGIAWYGVRDGRMMESSDPRRLVDKRAAVVEWAERQIGTTYDYASWLAVPYLRWGLNLSPFYAFDKLSNCSGLVAKAYHVAGLDLSKKEVLNLVTPDDLDFARWFKK